MTAPRDTDRLIRAFLHEGRTDLPDRAYDAVRSEIDHTRQRVVIGPWREEQMARFATFALAAAAVVLVAVIGTRFLPTGGGVGAQPTPTSTIAPPPIPSATPIASAPPTPSATAIADPSGRLQPGTYVVQPFDTLLGMDARSFTFTTPSANWEAVQFVALETIGVMWNDGSDSAREVGLGFLKVHSLNGDACHWVGTDDDVAVGPTVDDLIEALASATTFEGGDEPYTEYVSNATGQGVELVIPATEISDCDNASYRIWNAEGFDISKGIYEQKRETIWRLGIFDVSGERYIVMAKYLAETPDEVISELESIFRSVVIDSSPGCPRYDHTCN